MSISLDLLDDVRAKKLEGKSESEILNELRDKYALEEIQQALEILVNMKPESDSGINVDHQEVRRGSRINWSIKKHLVILDVVLVAALTLFVFVFVIKINTFFYVDPYSIEQDKEVTKKIFNNAIEKLSLDKAKYVTTSSNLNHNIPPGIEVDLRPTREIDVLYNSKEPLDVGALLKNIKQAGFCVDDSDVLAYKITSLIKKEVHTDVRRKSSGEIIYSNTIDTQVLKTPYWTLEDFFVNSRSSDDYYSQKKATIKISDCNSKLSNYISDFSIALTSNKESIGGAECNYAFDSEDDKVLSQKESYPTSRIDMAQYNVNHRIDDGNCVLEMQYSSGVNDDSESVTLSRNNAHQMNDERVSYSDRTEKNNKISSPYPIENQFNLHLSIESLDSRLRD